jgi:Fe-S-cluster containining protein
MTHYRLRSSLQLRRDDSGKTLLNDPALKRVLRLGPHDARLARALTGKGRSFTALEAALGPEVDVSARLSAFAVLFLLDGPRSDLRLTLGARAPPAVALDMLPLRWLEGSDPPRHSCVSSGACCSSSFLGPLTVADQKRIVQLRMGGRARVASGTDALEELAFRGVTYVGMAREAGRCVALGEDELCDLHATHGIEAKPTPCQQFPLRLHHARGAIHVSLLLACEGYDRGRGLTNPDWSLRADEIRSLLRRGGVAIPLAWPLLWSAGLPVDSDVYWALQQHLVANGQVDAAGACADPREWLRAAVTRFDATASAHAAAISEGAEIRVLPQVRSAIAALEGGQWDDNAIAEQVGGLDERATMLRAQQEPADSHRLARLARVYARLNDPSLEEKTTLSAIAGRLQADIVANDLPAALGVGELDVGLTRLASRLVIADVDMRLRAIEAGRSVVNGNDATLALKLVARSDADIAAITSALPA